MAGVARSLRLMALASCAFVSAAHAQADSVIGHHGWQFAIGGASATTVGSCGGCPGSGLPTHGYSLMLRMGAAITPQLVVSPEFDQWDSNGTGNGESATLELLTVQYYPNVHKGFYISAGVGVAQLEGGVTTYGIDPGAIIAQPPNVVGFKAGAGYDWHMAGSYFLTPAIDVLYTANPRNGDPFVKWWARPAVIRAGLSIGRQPGGEVAHEVAERGDERRGLQVAFGVAEGIKPGACAGCSDVGGPNGGTAYALRVGWPVLPNLVVSAAFADWHRTVLHKSETVTWPMLTTQFYPDARKGLYINAGIGRAEDGYQLDYSGYSVQTLGLLAGIGYETSPRGFFSASPSLDVLYAMPQRETSGALSARIGTTLICAGMTLVWR